MLKGLRGDKRTILLVIVVATLASLNLFLYSDLVQARSDLSEARDELGTVSGIILSTKAVEYDDSGEVGYIILLRLVSEDPVNVVAASEISEYRLLLDSYMDLEVGNLVTGKPMKGETPALRVQSVTPFFLPPIVNTGEYIDFEVVELNTVGPSFYLGLHNLGEKDIISIRIEVNGTLIPFFFGVDKEHPVKPYEYMHDTVPTSWFDPATNGTAGFNPIHGETYSVVVRLTLSDDRPIYHFKSVKTWDFSATALSAYSVETFVPFESIIRIKSAYLFEQIGNEDFLSIVVKNVWVNPVTDIEILVDDIQIANLKTNLKSGKYWEACIRLPFNIYVGSSHKVFVRALTEEGEFAELSKEVRCERM
jgi:hypothetical protein